VNRPEDLVSVGDELTLLVIRVDPNERRIGLSLKELAHAVAEAPPQQDFGGGRGRGKRGKSREYDYDDEE
jgi:ribosomal protein S1